MQQPWPQPFYFLPPAAYGPPVPPRPGWATAAAIILLVSGGIFAFYFLIFFLIGLTAASTGGSSAEQLDPIEARAAGTAVLVLGMVGGIWTAGQLAAGIGILRRRPWARILGIVLSGLNATLFILLAVLVLVGAAYMGDPAFADAFGPELAKEMYGPYAAPEEAAEAVVQTFVVAAITVAVSVGFVAIAYLCALFGLVRTAAYFAWRPPSPGGPPWAGPPPRPAMPSAPPAA